MNSLVILTAIFESIFLIVIPASIIFLLVIFTYSIVKITGKYHLITKVCINTLIFLLLYTTILTIIDSSLRVRTELNINRPLESILKDKSLDETERYLSGYYKKERFGKYEEYLYYYKGGIFDSIVFWILYKDGKLKDFEIWYGWGNKTYMLPMGIQWHWFLIILITTLIFGFGDLFIGNPGTHTN